MDEIDVLLKKLDGKSSVEVLTGKFVDVQDSRVRIDFGAGPVPMETATSYWPEVNELVQVARIDGKLVMLGSSVPRPGQGTVTMILDPDYVKVATSIGDITATHSDDQVIAPGDIVKLYWQDGAYILSVMAISPPRQDPDGGNVGSGTIVSPDPFTALWSGQWSHPYGKWQNDNPRASDNVSGAWGLGTKFSDTVPNDATLVSLEVFLPNIRDVGVCFIGAHGDGSGSRPGGWVGVAVEIPAPGRNGWVLIDGTLNGQTVTSGIFDYLKVTPGGVTVTSGNGDNLWTGFPADGLSGALRSTYQLA